MKTIMKLSRIVLLALPLSACFHQGWVKDEASEADEERAIAQCTQAARSLPDAKRQEAISNSMTSHGWEKVELANEDE